MHHQNHPEILRAAQELKSGNLRAAQILLVRILKDNPEQAESWYLLSFTLQNQDQVLDALQRALKFRPQFTAARMRLQQVSGQFPYPRLESVRGESLIDSIRADLDANRFDSARDNLRTLLKQNPDHPMGWYLWSFVEVNQRGKIIALRQAIRLDPDFREARSRLQEIHPQALRKVSPYPKKTEPKPQLQGTLAVEIPSSQKTRDFWNMAGYILRRAIVIITTIVLGVYITVLIANHTGQIDMGVKDQIENQLSWMRYNSLTGIPWEEREQAISELRLQMTKEYGLVAPLYIRNLRWTWNALRFSWGNVLWNIVGAIGSSTDIYSVNKVILSHLPNTLLIIGTADFFIFIVGIPLALFLATRLQGHWFDRLVAVLSPLSSIPSWVHGILLLMIFAIQLRVLPYGGKYDILPAETWLGNVMILAKHMVLPVISVILGLFFQLVYSWRTYFMIYSDEDYVDLARAKGLSQRHIERRYVLRPTIPYIITSFALTLVGFWQMTTALEYIFNWPGIGYLYVASLPHFWGETMFPGEMSIIICLVVIFAYMLGIIVLLLDLIYAWIDPRIRIVSPTPIMSRVSRKIQWKSWRRSVRSGEIRTRPKSPKAYWQKVGWGVTWANLIQTFKNSISGTRNVLIEVLRYPSAIIGLIIILIFVGGSVYAVTALPYVQIGELWSREYLTGRYYVPKNVPAKWVNWFRINNLPQTITAKSSNGSIIKEIQEGEGELGEIQFSTSFDYPYREFPQDVILYIDPVYANKYPHLTITWITPDGRQIQPKSPSAKAELTYIFSEYLSLRSHIRKNENWQQWFVVDEQNHTPEFYVLFADPDSDEPAALPGTYQLQVRATTFEPGTDVDIEFLIMGRVYGWAGTDYLRRDLVIPLLWGLPFAMAFGLLGSLVTTIISMVLAATGVWLGGWFDRFIQYLTEVNMIMPVLAIGILFYAIFNISLWTVLIIIVLLGVFGGPTKAFRAAFLQTREAPYIEAAQAYGATNSRIIFKYMIPRIIPVLIPQLVLLMPSLVFLEATLGILNVQDPRFPTWGRVIFEALTQNALWGGVEYWVLEPLTLLLTTGLAFALFGFALERVLNPRLQHK